MFCIKCGAKNPDGSKFCSTCGATMVDAQELNGSHSTQSAPAPQPQSTSSPVMPSLPPAPTPRTPSAPMPPMPTVNPQQSSSYSPDPSRMSVSGYTHGFVHCPKCGSDRLISGTDVTTTTKSSGYKGSLGCLGFLMWGPLGLLCGLCGMGSKTTTNIKDKLICQDCGNEFPTIEEKKRELASGAIQSIIIGVVALIACFPFFGDGSVLMGLFSLLVAVCGIIYGIACIKDRFKVDIDGYDASCFKENEDRSLKS